MNPVAYICLQWEDPVRTLGSYLIALSILIGTHYLPLTQIAVKVGAVVFGGTQFDAAYNSGVEYTLTLTY